MKTNSLDFDAQALREHILDLAMRGKLVKQDPNDEPASVLLEKIKAEKAELVKEGKIKKSKALPEITDDEKPFDIPDSWEWVRLGDVTNIVMGQAPKGTTVNEVGEGTEFHQGKTEFTDKIIGRSVKYTTSDNKIIDDEYILMAVRAPVGDVNLLNRKISIGRGLAGIRPYVSNKEYIFYYLDSIKDYYEANSTGSTFKAINGNTIKNTPLPLPPLEEQSRIAVKIAQLFALLRKVESSTQQYAKLQTLLKSKVLDLAMRGKLVKQDPNDEPASVLLEKIKAEKEQLIKEKKIKKSKPLPPIKDDEKPFDIPDSWEWVRLGEVNTYIGKNIHPEKTPEQLFELYSVPIYETNSPEITSGKEIKSNKQTVIPDDILLCKINPRINRVWRVGNYTNYKNIASTEWIVVRQSQLLPDYLRYVLMSPYFRKLLQSNVSGVGGSLTRAKPVLVKKYVIPIPPFSEQSKISLKIAHLFTLLNTDRYL